MKASSNSSIELDTTTTLFRCSTGTRFLPAIEAHHFSDIDLSTIFNSFLIPKESRQGMSSSSNSKHVATKNSNTVKLFLNPVSDCKQIQLDEYAYPEFKKSYNAKNPSVSYDLALMQFKSMAGSTIWYSNRIKRESFYFSCLIHSSIAHAAAITGNGVLHGGFFSYENRGFLLPGETCSGKSTLCMLAMLANGTAISDDMVILADTCNGFEARALRSYFLARKNTYALLPKKFQDLCTAVNTEFEIKQRLDRDKVLHLTNLSSSINAIVLPQINFNDSDKSIAPFRLQQTPKSTALKKIMESLDATVLMPGLTEERSTVTNTVIRLVSALPCYELLLRPAFLHDPVINMNCLLEELLQLTDVQSISR